MTANERTGHGPGAAAGTAHHEPGKIRERDERDGLPRVRLTGTVRLPAGARDPWALFTPRGEQAWAPGWAPRFPAEAVDDAEPGTVFQTSHDGQETVWVVGGRTPGRSIQYARVTPGQMAGTVTVTLGPAPAGPQPAAAGPGGEPGDGRAATVTYDLTALSPAGAAHLAGFARGFGAYLRHWEGAIARALARP